MNRRREFAVFALRPGRLPAGPGDVTGCERLHPQHSPACTAVPRTGVYRRDSPSSQWEAVVEVSLSPRGIVAPCMPPQGLWFTLIAPAAPSSRRTTSRSTAWFRTCDTRYSVVKIQSRKCIPSISGTFLRGKLHVASKLFQNFLHSAKSL